MEQLINGNLFRDAVLSGAANLTNHKREVDELNVFPVPDGDTGTNMSMTIGNAARQLPRLIDRPVGEVAEETAACLLRGARGNSGVILSLLFRGISKGLKGLDAADGAQLSAALTMGVSAAYRAVMKPTEGTMLTVARVASEKAAEAAETVNDPVRIWEIVCSGASEALSTTPDLLPVLKKAGVVDAGGKGLTYIFEGMLSFVRDGVLITTEQQEEARKEEPHSAVATAEADITFTYCTEYVVKRDKGNPRDPISLRAFLETIGDCVVVVDDEEIIKVHCHSDNPGKVIQEGLKFGQLVKVKIDNMREQNEKLRHEDEAGPVRTEEGEAIQSVPPEHPFGFVAVAAGDGIAALFSDLGTDRVVRGGQTMNPSTDDILRAIESVPAETVFVLPNNKNIIMAAEQAVPLATRRVCVLHTRSIPMGISAMLAFDESLSADENIIAMNDAADHVGTGLITYAARDSEYDGHKIRQGEIMALLNGKVSFLESEDMTKAVVRLTRQLGGKSASQITLIYGEDVTEEAAEAVRDAVAEKAPEAEVALINGGQPVYYYIIAVE